jgi:glutamine synthetase
MGYNANVTALLDKYLKLEQHGKVLAEYIWIGGSGEDLRSKTRTLYSVPKSISELPEWNYDGSSTEQAPGHNSEVIIKPQAIFKDPFRGGDNILVMCDTYDREGQAIPTNTRYPASLIFDQTIESEPWFGLEQEYTLFNLDKHPYGWPKVCAHSSFLHLHLFHLHHLHHIHLHLHLHLFHLHHLHHLANSVITHTLTLTQASSTSINV